VRIAREARVAALFTTAANYPGANVITKAGGSSWDDVGVINTVQPITDIEAVITTVSQSAFTTRAQLTVVIPELVMNLAIRHNSAIRDYFKYTQGGVTTAEVLAALLGVREVLIAREQTAGAGPQNAASTTSSPASPPRICGATPCGRCPRHGRHERLHVLRTFNWTEATDGEELASSSTAWPTKARKVRGSRPRKRWTRRSSPASPAECRERAQVT
jgi:hypothetical protein